MWLTGERVGVVVNATARVNKLFEGIGTMGYDYCRVNCKKSWYIYVTRTACRVTSASRASPPTKYTSTVVVGATS